MTVFKGKMQSSSFKTQKTLKEEMGPPITPPPFFFKEIFVLERKSNE